MTKFIEKEAATRDEAIQLALDELGMQRDDVSVEVLEEGKKGFPTPRRQDRRDERRFRAL